MVTGARWVSGPILGLPKNAAGMCYMPNAAIGWKQPNGFFYPPAFYSTNLYFNNVDTRHFVIEPLFLPATGKNTPPYPPNTAAISARYCNGNADMFTGYTDVDRQTILNDEDGSLTGFVHTISVNFDSPFFTAPTEAVECASDETAKTSPYDYVTTVVYPYCGNACRRDVTNPAPPPDFIQIWDTDCANERCYGVPLYRQLLTPAEKIAGTVPLVRMSGQATGQRSTLTANGATYYIDTTVSEATQKAALANDPAKRPPKLNVFESGKTYYAFLLFARSTTKQTYQLYVGDGFNPDTDVSAVRANVTGVPVTFPTTITPWPWAKPDYTNGVLTVTLDMSAAPLNFKTNYDTTRKQSCLPESFCSPSGEGDQLQCKCSDQLKTSDPQLFAECQKDNDAICSWAVKDVDCPDGGCYGFAVKLGTLKYDQVPDVRPAPKLFTDDQANFSTYWKVFFQDAAPPDLAGNCAVKPTPISAFKGLATGVGGPLNKGSVSLQGTFTPKLNSPLIFDLAAAQNVTLNSVLHTKAQDGDKELLDGFPLPMRLVRQTTADPTYTATFALAAAGAPASPRLNVKQNGANFAFNVRIDNVTIKDAAGCGKPNADVTLITSFGIYDVAQPVEVEVEGKWDCANKSRYIGQN